MRICRKRWGLMQKLVKIGIMAAGFTALAVTIAFSFFAPGLAIVSGVVTALMVVLWADYQRRSVWEKVASKDIDVLKKAVRSVSGSVQDNRADIERLKRTVGRGGAARVAEKAQGIEAVRAEEVAATVLKSGVLQREAAQMSREVPVSKERGSTPAPSFAEALKAFGTSAVEDDIIEARMKTRPARVLKPKPQSKPKPRSQPKPKSVRRRAARRAKVSDIGALVARSLKQKKIAMFVQPVVTLPQGKTRFYELFARLEGASGVSVAANDYMGYARKNKVMSKIDGLLLMRSLKVIQGSRHVKKATPFFVNVSSATLKDAGFMGQLIAFLKDKKNKNLRERLIFEMSQEDYQSLPQMMVELMRGLGQLGCAFSLDHVTGFDLDVELMIKHRVRSIKIAAPRLIDEISMPVGLVTMQKFIRRMEGNGIAVIADRVETKAQLKALEALGLSYAQGYLFGRPAPQANYARKAKAQSKKAA